MTRPDGVVSYLGLVLVLLTVLWLGRAVRAGETPDPQKGTTKMADEKNPLSPGSASIEKIKRSPEEWRRLLNQEQYRVTREKGTERPFTGRYHNHKEEGVYTCVACGLDLFESTAKFDSGTGWPSFFKPIGPQRVSEEADNSFFMRRVEVLCARCESHLGHVFQDGPEPTGLRYCINSAALQFDKSDDSGDDK